MKLSASYRKVAQRSVLTIVHDSPPSQKVEYEVDERRVEKKERPTLRREDQTVEGQHKRNQNTPHAFFDHFTRPKLPMHPIINPHQTR